jgi:hypothetical protein
MTPTEQWIFELALVYAVPSFFAGVASTLAFLHRRNIAVTAARFLSPALTFEARPKASPSGSRGNVLPKRLVLEK